MDADAPARRRGWTLLAVGLAAGVAGDLLFRGVPGAGLAVPLWASLVAAAAAAVVRAWGTPVARDARRLALAALALTAGFAWREDPGLWALDVLLLAITVPLALHALHRGGLRRAHVSEYATGLLAWTAEMALAPLVLLTRDVPWQELGRGRGSAPAGALLRGALLAVPALLVFGSLFALADPVFRQAVADVAHALDLDAELVGHALAVAFFAALALAVVRPAALGPAVTPPGPRGPGTLPGLRPPIPLGATEVATALTLLNLLFLAFTAVQVRFLFGDADFVQRTAGLTYAAYARQGFFQLVLAAALVVPTLLAAHGLLPGEPRARRTFRFLAGALLVQVGVLLASALHRLRLYVEAYGLTGSRLYAAAALLWVAAVLAWLAATVVRDRRDRFAWGALVAAYGVTLLLHAVDPDALVARVNLDHYRRTGRYDALYATHLGAGAMPVLVPALAELPVDARWHLATVALHRWSDPPRDWRAWNWARARAAAVVARHREELRRALPPHLAPPRP